MLGSGPSRNAAAEHTAITSAEVMSLASCVRESERE
jgi:hypothetical protein